RLVDDELILPREAEHLASTLETLQEFLAWLVLRRNIVSRDRRLIQRLKDEASSVVRPETRRTDFGFPKGEVDAKLELEEALINLLRGESDHADDLARIHQSRLKLALLEKGTGDEIHL